MDRNISKKKVICDTMIWYCIGSGKISIPNNTEFQFVVTFNNFQEINHNEKILKDFNFVKNVCKAIVNYADIIIDESPIVYMHNIADPKNEIRRKESEYYKIVKEITKTNNIDFSDESLKQFYNLLNGYRQNIDENFVNHTTTEINKSRKIIHYNNENKQKCSRIIKENLNKVESLNNIKKQILNDIRFHFSGFQISNINFWEDINLYLHCRQKYFSLLKMDKNRKVEFNDLCDLLNLVYVNKNSLYWTEEGSWKEIIVQAGLGNYLYNQ